MAGQIKSRFKPSPVGGSDKNVNLQGGRPINNNPKSGGCCQILNHSDYDYDYYGYYNTLYNQISIYSINIQNKNKLSMNNQTNKSINKHSFII